MAQVGHVTIRFPACIGLSRPYDQLTVMNRNFVHGDSVSKNFMDLKSFVHLYETYAARKH